MASVEDDIQLIRDLIDWSGETAAAIARKIGVANTTINRFKKGSATTRIGRQTLMKLQAAYPNFPGFDEDAASGRSDDDEVGGSGATLEDLAAEYGLVFVEEIDLALGMGATFLDGGQPDVLGIVPFREKWIDSLYEGSVSHLKVVKGRGDSMEPTIRDGDTVLIDTSRRRIDDQDRIWAISYGDLGMIRRIRVTPRGSWMLMPDNQVVRPDEVGDGETSIIGRVIWIGRQI